jgi:quercetin dioxygenase-like cupin family protein
MTDDLSSVLDAAAVVARDHGQGALWSTETADLDVNLVAFPAGAGVAEHVNAEVDVLVVVLSGDGSAHIDGREIRLTSGVALIIPRGSRRAIRCVSGRLVYLTCHRRRASLTPERRNPR